MPQVSRVRRSGNDQGGVIITEKLKAIEKALEALSEHERECRLCPWECGVDRTEAEGRCSLGHRAKVSGYEPHFGEEACFVGRGGSGAVFFTSCNLFCVFCQTWEISREGKGVEISSERLAEIFLELQKAGCENINLITPTAQILPILKALQMAYEKGLRLPVIYNTGGYERAEVIRALEGVIDIYLPDFKLWDEDAAERYLGAKDYPEAARRAVKEMYRQVGNLVVDEEGVARKGLLVRHLVMPGRLEDTYQIMKFLAEEVSPEVRVNLMGHYHPVGDALKISEISRQISKEEWKKAIELANKAGIFNLDKTHWELLEIILLDNSKKT